MSAALPLIRITRVGGPYRDALRAYRVEIDGHRAGAIRPGQTVDFPIPPGEHGVRLTVDWCSSPLRVVRLGQGQWTHFVCRPNGWFFELWRTVIDTSNYIRLDQLPDPAAR